MSDHTIAPSNWNAAPPEPSAAMPDAAHTLPGAEAQHLLPAPGQTANGTNRQRHDRHAGGHSRGGSGKGRRIAFLVAIIVAVLLLLVLLLGWIPRHRRNKEAEQRASDQANSLPVVMVAPVHRASGGSGLTVPGTSTPLTEAYVYARANGYLKKRLVDIGDHVRQGQLLAILDAPDLDQQVDQAREQLRQAEAQKAQQETQLALNKVTFDRYSALVAKGVFSRQDGDQAEASYLAQVANVAAADRNIEAFRANLRRVIALQSYERVTAPFDGVITQRNVDVGALISATGAAQSSAPSPTSSSTPGTGTQAGMTNTGGSSGSPSSGASPSTGGAQGGALFGIAQTERLRVLVSVPEGYAGAIRTGQPATLAFQELPQTTFHGTVTRTAASLDQNTRTLLTEVQVNNHDGRLLSGMYAVVTFAAAGVANDAGPLLVPGDSVAVRQDRPVVGVVRDGTVHLVPVSIGRDLGPQIEIVAGLREGDLVVSTFSDVVREGARVRAMPDKHQQQQSEQRQSLQHQPPGGSTQYGDPGITDQEMQGQNAKPQQKQGGKGGAATKSSSQGSSKP